MIKDLKCPECGSNCYIWLEADVTDATTGPMNKECAIHCINDCGVVGTIDATVTLKKNTLKIDES